MVGYYQERERSQLLGPNLAMGVRGGLWGLWLPYQIGEAVPGSAETRSPTHRVLQVHPQARGDRVGTYHLKTNRLQPADRQHARRTVVVGTDRPQVRECHAAPVRRPTAPACLPSPLPRSSGATCADITAAVGADRSSCECSEPRHASPGPESGDRSARHRQTRSLRSSPSAG